MIVTLNTSIPDTAAASGFPPTAYRFFPNVVLFQINHTTITAVAAHKMIVGKLPILGIIISGISFSIAPKDTPFAAYVTIPKMINMLDMEEINGCILYFALKKPAMEVKIVHKIIHTTSAITALRPTGRFVKSNTLPNTAPVLIPLCMMIVEATMPIPTIRPIDKSVPASINTPATPNAKNILGEACCKIFKMLLTVNKGVFLIIGVTIPKPINTIIITRYRPLRNSQSLRLNVYK